MRYAIVVLLCAALSALIALLLVPLVVRLYKNTEIVYLFSKVCYESAKPQGMMQHCLFAVSVINSIPGLVEIKRKAQAGDYDEPKP